LSFDADEVAGGGAFLDILENLFSKILDSVSAAT
jgi:hypothetical protein